MKAAASFIRNTQTQSLDKNSGLLNVKVGAVQWVRLHKRGNGSFLRLLYADNVKPVTRSFCAPCKCHLAKRTRGYVCEYRRGQTRGHSQSCLCPSDRSS
jgi:hypothetical protein